MVMNRLSTTNLVEPITENLDFQDQTPFLLYRNGKGHIYGIWFYEEKSCLKIFKLLMSLSKLAFTKPDKSNSIRQRSYSESNRKQPKQDNAQTDIISLLTRAQDEYDKKSSAAKNSLWRNSKNSQHAANGDIVKPTPVRVNGAVASNSDLTPLTVGMLFARAGDKEKKPDENTRDFESRVKSFSTSSFKEPSGDSKLCSEAILQSLMSNSAHTLQHIESRQNNDDSYVEEKKGSSEPRALSAGERMLSVETLEKDLKEKLNLLPKTNCDVKIDSKVGVTTELKEPAKSE
ncbi:mRNA-decapping enzyme 1B, partial [Stegodyphus mimosarum]